MPDWEELSGKHHVTSYTSPRDSAFLKSLPVKDLDGFNTLIGSDFECVKTQRLEESELGQFLQGQKFEIVRSLSTSGFNSYCFEIRCVTAAPRFLKIFKPREWDSPSLKSCIYSCEQGVGCLVNNAQRLRSVVIPERVIGLNSEGALTDRCIEGNLVLATISPLLDQENLRSLMRRGRLDAPSVFKLMENILEAVASFKRCKITHRDLTPSNILVDSNTLTVAITDFDHATTGTCRPLDGPFAARESSSKIDEFTLGLVFLELHLGIHPCDRITGLEGAVRDLIYNGKIPLLKNESLIDLVIRGLLDVDPETRWTVFEALDCLQKRTAL
jgi:serine/threonine protein kinase